MPRTAARYALVAALAAACHAAGAQDGAPAPVKVVQQLAPQLIAFAGSQQNFENLVNGLSQGTPIQLTSVLPNGFTQVVSFTPTGTLTPVQIAQVLESTRQQLIGLGIGNPTGEQIANALAGAAVPTPASVAAIGASAPTPPARINTSDSPLPAGATSRTPVPGNVSNTPTPPAATPQPAQPAQMAQPATAPALRPMR